MNKFNLLILLLFVYLISSCSNSSNEFPVNLIMLDDKCIRDLILEYKTSDNMILPADKSKGFGKDIEFIFLTTNESKVCEDKGFAILENLDNFIYIIPTKMGTSLQIVYSYFDKKLKANSTLYRTKGGNLFFEFNKIDNVKNIIHTNNSIIIPEDKSIIYIEELSYGDENYDFLSHYRIYVLKGKILIQGSYNKENQFCLSNHYIEVKFKESLKGYLPIDEKKYNIINEEFLKLKAIKDKKINQ